MHLIGVEAGAEAGNHIKAHCLAACLTAHAVVVVEYVEEDRHSGIAVSAVHSPELGDLIHRSKVEGFKNRSASGRAVTTVGDNDSGLVVGSLIESRTESYRS